MMTGSNLGLMAFVDLIYLARLKKYNKNKMKEWSKKH